MTPAETARLVRLVQQACPAQRFEEGTPVLWHKMLDDLRYVDCQDAVIELGKRTVFMAPAEIRAEVRRIRAERLRAVPSSALEPADVNPNEVEAYQAARLRLIRSIADGDPAPQVRELPAASAAARADAVEKLAARTLARLPRIPRESA